MPAIPATADLTARWQARAWAAYARGDPVTAHAVWACVRDLEEAVLPRIIPRAEWGFDGWATQPATVPTGKRTGFFVHYEGGTSTRAATGPSVPRAIHAYHRKLGWAGIGYTWVVTQDGAIYEGRGWDYSGAHCPGYNTSAWSVQVHIGGDDKPTDAALHAARWLYDQACARAGRTLTRYGHRDGIATSCPGDRLYAWVKAGMPDPGATDDPTPQTVWGQGDTGEKVREIQAIVGAAVDGDWGPLTTAAVKAWQTTHGLTADGLWGPDCEAAARTTKPSTPTPSEGSDMRIITDGTRTALVGPGYLCRLDTQEAVDAAKALAPVVAGNARQYDLWAAACTQGRAALTLPPDLAGQVVDLATARLVSILGGAK